MSLPEPPADDVRRRIARAGKGRRARVGQVLDIGEGSKRVAGQTRLDRVGSATGSFRHHISGIVYNVVIIPNTAAHMVSACATVQEVVAAPTDENVIASTTCDIVAEFIARSGERASTCIGQELNVHAKIVGRQGCFYGIHSLACILNDHIAGVIDDTLPVVRSTDSRRENTAKFSCKPTATPLSDVEIEACPDAIPIPKL